jgi:hypothetical protein
MNRIFYAILPLLFLFSLVAAPLKAQIPHLVFHAELSGSEAIPSVNTDGKGLISFIFTPDRSKVSVSGMLVNLEGNITEATIRLGITGETGVVLLDFLPLISGRRIVGELDVPPALLPNLLLNGVYAEVRTTAHPVGEIRGQFTCEADLDYSALLTGDQVDPATGSSAIAFGGLHFPLGSEDLVYAFTFRGLSSAVTKVLILEGNTIVTYMPNMAAGLIQGLLETDTIPSDFLLKAREGRYDVLICTANFPQGEIKGNLKHVGYFGSVAPVNGVQLVPPAPTQAFGFSETIHNPTMDSLTTRVFVNNLMPTSVKIHTGAPGQIGPELVTLDTTDIPGFYSKKYPITEATLTDFAQGLLYVNVTSAAAPNGAIRGAMKNTLRKAYAFDLCGLQMVPPTNSDALGIAVASVDQANCYLNYKMITDGLASVPVDGYYAQAALGQNGIAFHALPNTEPIIAGSHEIMAVLGPIIENSGTYVQIATMGNPNGEIRGQVRRGYSCPEVLSATELDNIQKVVVSPVPFRDFMTIEFESAANLEGRLRMYDMMGIPAFTQNIQIQSGAQSIQINTGHLPPGIYSISLELPGSNEAVLLKKVVKVQ